MEARNPWDDEYGFGSSIPTTFRHTPSAGVVWLFDNWSRLGDRPAPLGGLDIGCGTGRNSFFLAERGVTVRGFDYSRTAVDRADAQATSRRVTNVQFTYGDLTESIPADDDSIDLAIDIFASLHVIEPSARRRYFSLVRRTLTPGGLFLLSLAMPDDGYYSACPPASRWRESSPVPVVIDPKMTGVETGLWDLQSLTAELGQGFELLMSWRQVKRDIMHGEEHRRCVLATVWSPLPGP